MRRHLSEEVPPLSTERPTTRSSLFGKSVFLSATTLFQPKMSAEFQDYLDEKVVTSVRADLVSVLELPLNPDVAAKIAEATPRRPAHFKGLRECGTRAPP